MALLVSWWGVISYRLPYNQVDPFPLPVKDKYGEEEESESSSSEEEDDNAEVSLVIPR